MVEIAFFVFVLNISIYLVNFLNPYGITIPGFENTKYKPNYSSFNDNNLWSIPTGNLNVTEYGIDLFTVIGLFFSFFFGFLTAPGTLLMAIGFPAVYAYTLNMAIWVIYVIAFMHILSGRSLE